MEPRNAKIFKKFGNKFLKEQSLYIKPFEQMQQMCAMKNLWSAILKKILDNATVAMCIVCKPVGSTQTLNSTCKAASNSNLA